MKRTKLADRKIPDYTRGEEIFNMVTHIAGGAFAVAALVLCVWVAAVHGNVCGIVTGAVYGGTMIVLYTMSSIYHGLPADGTSKKVFQVIDHCAIFLLIAGTFTPLALCGLRPAYPALGWGMFGVIWASAVLGVTLNAIDLRRFRVFSMICYVGLSWCVLLVIKPLTAVLPPGALWCLFGGGVAYTIGAVLYGLGKKRRFIIRCFTSSWWRAACCISSAYCCT